MAKFRIWAKSIDYCYLDIEADSEEEAMEVAEDADGSDFHTDGIGAWDLMKYVDRLDDSANVDYTYEEMFGETED